MNQNEVLAILHDIIANNQKYTTWTVSTPHLVMLVNKAVEAEREACIVDIQMHIPRAGRQTPEYQRAMRMIERIRARGQE